MPEERSIRHGFRTLPLLCGTLTVALGLVAFVGWISGMSLLASIRSKYIPMAPSTALCFTLIGAGLILCLRWPDLGRVARVFASLVLFVAVAKLVEIIGNLHFGIDAWFVRNPELFGAVPTGRMAPLTALTFIFTAVAMFLLSLKPPSRWTCPLGALATAISAVVLVGYWYGTPLLYGGSVIPVALPTACGFFLSGISIMTAAGEGAWPVRAFCGDSTRALLLRAFVPMIAGAALINGWAATFLMQQGRANPAVISALCAIGFAGLVTWIITQVSGVVGGRIDRAEQDRNVAQAELVALNAVLENRVEERTRELSAKNDQMRQDLQMARELQAALLPRHFPKIPADAADQESSLRFLSLYFPTGDVSGDFFSVFPVGENAAGVLICDVMGHGVRSALITSMIRGLVGEHATAAADPGELLTRINHALTLIFKQAETTMFATCFYVVADVARGELRFSNAGHPSALHVRKSEVLSAEKLEGEGRRGPAMGIFPTAKYTTTTRPMTEGDLILLFTDGLFEVEDASGELFSEEQLRETVGRHAALAPDEFFGRVLDDVRGFSQRDSFDDDVCVVGIKVQHMADPTPARKPQELSSRIG